MHFQQLLVDLHIKIFDSLDPFDILSLRKTCRALHHATSQRIVWINALRRVCIRNIIFMPTFPIHDMSVLALEYAATGPDSFLRNHTGLLIARSHRIILCKGHEFISIFLVPGGRYLVTLTDISLEVWDLGIPGHPLREERTTTPISTIPVAKSHVSMHVHPSEDGKGLTILLKSSEGENILFSIFRIYPDDENPLLLKIAEMAVPDIVLIYQFSLIGNKLIYMNGPTLNVWDFKEDAWACIEVPDDEPEHFIVAKTAVLLFYGGNVSIWEIPPLSTNKPFYGSPPSRISPTCSLKTSIIWDEVIASKGACDWYSGSTQQLLIDISYGLELQRFEILHINEDWNNSAIVNIGTHPIDGIYGSFRFCNDTLVFRYIFGGIFYARVSRLPSATLNPFPEPVNSLNIRDMRKYDGYGDPSTLCPVSGRLAYIDDTNKLKIMDYISESLPVLGELVDF